MNRTTIGIALVILLAAGLIGHFDAEGEQIEQEQYCEMVSIWKDQAKAGIPKERRDGWPPYKGDKFCQSSGDNR